MSARGPGALVVVVGPSGAGKDTLIAIARDLLAGEAQVVFPRRVVTRPPEPGEDHDSLAEDAFDAAVGRGDFAIWWAAHGLFYGIPAAIDDDIAAGRTVVCNVSRAIVPALRARYAACRVILVTAPRAVRAARLAARGRASDGDPDRRLDRAVADASGLAPDAVIDNVGPAQDGGRRLAALVQRMAPHDAAVARPCLP